MLAPRLQPGTIVADRFVLERLAGAGGMGEVYRARDRTTGGVVGLKLLHAGEGVNLARFLREARVLARLEHPSVVRYAGFSTAEAHDGEEALVRARVTRPSMMVVDLVMPGSDGFELIRRLREENMLVPIVVLTGKTVTDAERQSLRDSIAALVHKNGHSIESVVNEAKRLVLEQRSASALRLPRVLYVEDSAQNRDVVRRYLHGTFEVLEAFDGEHGLDRAQRDEPHLILMDLSLPRLDGWEATRRLKAGPLAAIPVVALTAHASREDQARARAAGCDGYLTKPVERDVLIATVNKHLSAARRRPPAPS
jgi:CheY-like chemotaxis protein